MRGCWEYIIPYLGVRNATCIKLVQPNLYNSSDAIKLRPRKGLLGCIFPYLGVRNETCIKLVPPNLYNSSDTDAIKLRPRKGLLE